MLCELPYWVSGAEGLISTLISPPALLSVAPTVACLKMFLAAFSSRSWIDPQLRQTHCRTFKVRFLFL